MCDIDMSYFWESTQYTLINKRRVTFNLDNGLNKRKPNGENIEADSKWHKENKWPDLIQERDKSLDTIYVDQSA